MGILESTFSSESNISGMPLMVSCGCEEGYDLFAVQQKVIAQSPFCKKVQKYVSFRNDHFYNSLVFLQKFTICSGSDIGIYRASKETRETWLCVGFVVGLFCTACVGGFIFALVDRCFSPPTISFSSI